MNGQILLENYLNNGVDNIIKGAMRATLSNPKESIFMAKYALVSKKASKVRAQFENKDEHIPPFLIASITNECKGKKFEDELTSREWLNIFNEAKEIGVSFILVAGGEPLLRQEVLEVAGEVEEIIFPVFTKGTLIEGKALDLFEEHRNLVPILSLAGYHYDTDDRRGQSVYEGMLCTMEKLKKNKILYGASITVTSENIYEVTADMFLEQLAQKGCKIVAYVEYVPVAADEQDLELTQMERLYLIHRVAELRRNMEDILFISLPEDEKMSGGCLGAGRGFFHINAQGGAEPCPFSPYSDTNLRNASLRQALQSPLFKKLQQSDILTKTHFGSCVLFNEAEEVERMQATLSAIK